MEIRDPHDSLFTRTAPMHRWMAWQTREDLVDLSNEDNTGISSRTNSRVRRWVPVVGDLLREPAGPGS